MNDKNARENNAKKDLLLHERGVTLEKRADPVQRLRRRIEDVLRKSDDETILRAARFLGIKTEMKGDEK